MESKRLKKLLIIIICTLAVLFSIYLFLNRYGICAYSDEKIEQMMIQEIRKQVIEKKASFFGQKLHYKVKILSAAPDISDFNCIKLDNCKFDAECRINRKLYRTQPFFSGEAKIIQLGEKIVLKDIIFEKTDAVTDRYGINDKIIWCINQYFYGREFHIYDSPWLKYFKLELKPDGLYVKLK